MRISVVIPTANRPNALLRAVSTALQQDFPSSDYEIIVVLDGPSDASAQALRVHTTDSRLRLLQLEKNQGPSAARNAGWRAASSDLIVFLDDDTICTPGLLQAHAAAHEASGNIVGLGAIYLQPGHPPNLAAQFFLRGLGAEYARHRDCPDCPWPENVWSFANTSVARTVLETVGGFDVRFRKREDGELGIRLLDAGVQPTFVSRGVAWLSCDKSAQQLLRDAEMFADCDLLFVREHPGRNPHEFLNHLRQEKPSKRQLRRMFARHLREIDLLLAPLCSIGEWRAIPGSLRNLAVRSLQFRCGLHWYRRILEASDSQAENWVREDG